MQVLLDNEYYVKHMQRPLARWTLLWLHRHFVGAGKEVLLASLILCSFCALTFTSLYIVASVHAGSRLLIDYMCGTPPGNVDGPDGWRTVLETGLQRDAMKLLNLAA